MSALPRLVPSILTRARARAITRHVLSRIGDGVVICEPNMRIMFANPAVGILLECDPETLVGQDALALIDPADRARVMRAFRRCLLSNGARAQATFGVVDRTDSPLRIDAVAYNSTAEPEIGGIVVTFRDITAQWKAQDTLRQSEALYRELVEDSTDAIGIATADGTLLHVNRAMCELTGFSPDQLVGQPMHTLCESGEHARARAALEMLRHGEPMQAEYALRRRDGSLLSVEMRSRRLHDGRLHLVMRDASTHSARERRAAHRRRLEAIGALAANVGHDFNNLLTIIIGNATDVASSLTATARETEAMDDLLSAASHGKELVKRMLRGTRVDGVRAVSVDLAEICVPLRRAVRQLLPSDIGLSVDFEAELPRVYADPIALEECILNLATNARDAMPDGGTLICTVGRATSFGSTGEDPTPDARHFVAIRMTDSGCGMDESTTLRAFEPYFTSKTPDLGTGLGLSAVYQLMQEQGGFVTLSSAPGRGTTATLHLPIVTQSAA